MGKSLIKFKNKRIKSYFFLTINTIVWGAALIIVKPAFEHTTPFRYLLYRFVLAAIFSIPILVYYWPKVKNKLPKLKKIMIIEFIGTVVALSLLYLGLDQTTAIEASFISITTPIFIVLAGVLYLKEKEEPHEIVGLTIAFLGTALLTSIPLILNGGNIYGISIKGNLLIIGQNIATAIAFILAKKYYKGIPKLFVTSASFYLAIVFFLFLSLQELNFSIPTFIETVKVDLSHTSVLFASFYMAIFGSIIGLTAYIKGQEGIEASEASLFWYLQPLVFIPLGMMVLGEQVHALQIISMMIILTGVYIAERRAKIFKKR